jgi:hypothetical protein
MNSRSSVLVIMICGSLAEKSIMSGLRVPGLPTDLSHGQVNYLQEWAHVATRMTLEDLLSSELGKLIDWRWEWDHELGVLTVVTVALRRPEGARVVYRQVVLPATGPRFEAELAAELFALRFIEDLETRLPQDLAPEQTVQVGVW